MRNRVIAVAAAFTLFAAAAAWASFSGGGNKEDSPKPASSPEAGSPMATSRQEAERLYTDGYDEVQRAKSDVTAGKTKNAEKRFRRALERAERATELDTTYHEAWNLAGYSARKLGEYDKALAAYAHCLRLKPLYAPAREYLGEAYVELGRIKEAREQLMWLDKLNVPDDANTLRAAIETYEKAHPTAAPAVAAPADTTTKGQ